MRSAHKSTTPHRQPKSGDACTPATGAHSHAMRQWRQQPQQRRRQRGPLHFTCDVRSALLHARARTRLLGAFAHIRPPAMEIVSGSNGCPREQWVSPGGAEAALSHRMGGLLWAAAGKSARCPFGRGHSVRTTSPNCFEYCWYDQVHPQNKTSTLGASAALIVGARAAMRYQNAWH